ncbi:MAG: aspartate/glutamate racemase family protein [Pseudomonadota bacterium]
MAERLKAAGAEVLVISSIGGHFCIDAFRPVSPLPVLDMIDAMNAHMAKAGHRRVGLLGTDTVMATRFYGGLAGVDVLIPPEDKIPGLHRAYADMAISGQVTPETREAFFTAGREMATRGAEVVLLGGTDLFLAFDGDDPGFPVLDCALVHVDAILEAAA